MPKQQRIETTLYPWEGLPHDFAVEVPWPDRKWYTNIQTGRFTERGGRYSRDEDGKVVIDEEYPIPSGAIELLYDDMRDCQALQKESNCSFFEAVADVKRDSVTKGWLKEAAKAPRVLYANSDELRAQVAEEDDDEPEFPFNPPSTLKKAAPKKRGGSRPRGGNARKRGPEESGDGAAKTEEPVTAEG